MSFNSEGRDQSGRMLANPVFPYHDQFQQQQHLEYSLTGSYILRIRR